MYLRFSPKKSIVSKHVNYPDPLSLCVKKAFCYKANEVLIFSKIVGICSIEISHFVITKIICVFICKCYKIKLIFL